VLLLGLFTLGAGIVLRVSRCPIYLPRKLGGRPVWEALALLDDIVAGSVPEDLREDFRLLREHLRFTGTKEACGSGECGACTILVDGETRLACLMLAAQLQDRRVLTIEGLADGKRLHALQQAFIDHGAVQCGYCTPGMVIAGEALLRSLDLRQMEGDPGFFGSSLWSSRTHDASVWVNECASLARPVVGLFTS